MPMLKSLSTSSDYCEVSCREVPSSTEGGGKDRKPQGFRREGKPNDSTDRIVNDMDLGRLRSDFYNIV